MGLFVAAVWGVSPSGAHGLLFLLNMEGLLLAEFRGLCGAKD